MAEGDALCEDYLRRLTAALSGVPARDRDVILTQIRDHLVEARAALPVQTDAGVEQILDRLGPPEEIAQAAQNEAGVPRDSKRRVRGLTTLTAVFALIALGLGVAALTGAFGNNQTPEPRMPFRPAWRSRMCWVSLKGKRRPCCRPPASIR